MIVKKFLVYFSFFSPENYMFYSYWTYTKTLFQLFQHTGPHHTLYILKGTVIFSELQFKGPLWILKVSPKASIVKVVVVLLELQTKQVFFPHGSHLLFSLVLVNTVLTKKSLRLLPIRNPTTVTLGNTF